jgi:thiol-disulfide isomerase/thioredoxin
MKNVILVKTKWCPYCPSASSLWKELHKKYKFNYKEVDATSPEGQKLVQKFSIMAVPTTIIDDKVAFVGVPSKEKAEEVIKK